MTNPKMCCKVYSMVNQKGGVGKTTTTANLGIGLVREGYKVLLIDADSQASLTLALGFKNPDDMEVTIFELMMATIEENPFPQDFGILHHDEGVDLIPSNIMLSTMEFRMASLMSRESVLREVIDELRPQYDYILIDCTPSLGLITVNALAASDNVIIPTQPAFLSVKGINQLLHSISRIKKQINPRLSISGILFTMVNSRTIEAQNIIDSLRITYSDRIQIFKSAIPFSVRASETSTLGKSIYAHDRNGKVAAAYEALTKEVISDEKRRD